MKRLAMAFLIIFLVGGAMAQVSDPLGTLRQIHKRIAKQDTDIYINALVDTVKTSAAFANAAARKLFLTDFNMNLGINELAEKPNAEELRQLRETLATGPWTDASKLAAWNYLKQNLEAVAVEAGEGIVEK